MWFVSFPVFRFPLEKRCYFALPFLTDLMNLVVPRITRRWEQDESKRPGVGKGEGGRG